MRVTLAIALPDRQEVIDLDLADGATIAEALGAARLAVRFPGLDVAALDVGVWSRVAKRTTRLREGDRVELYRRLRADPKSMRRSRARLRTSPRSRSGP